LKSLYIELGNSADTLRHPRSDAYSAELVLLNKQQICGGRTCLHCYCELLLESHIFVLSIALP